MGFDFVRLLWAWKHVDVRMASGFVRLVGDSQARV